MTVNNAGDSCKESGKDENKKLVIGDVDTHGFRRNFVVTNRRNGSAVFTLDDILNQEQRDKHHDKGNDEKTALIGGGTKTERTAEGFHVFEDVTDDFTERKRNDGKIVALEP